MPIIKNTEKGKSGELLAETFLMGLHYQILTKNYRYKRAELDIVAMYGNELVVVEVKLRKNNTHGYPEEFISASKQNLIKKAAYHFKEENDIKHPIRFDVISISIEEKEIKHFKDAF